MRIIVRSRLDYIRRLRFWMKKLMNYDDFLQSKWNLLWKLHPYDLRVGVTNERMRIFCIRSVCIVRCLFEYQCNAISFLLHFLLCCRLGLNLCCFLRLVLTRFLNQALNLPSHEIVYEQTSLEIIFYIWKGAFHKLSVCLRNSIHVADIHNHKHDDTVYEASEREREWRKVWDRKMEGK